MNPIIRLALFEPDIPQNAAAILRTCACLGLACEVIEPCGFILGGSHMRRVGMDYLDNINVVRHLDWRSFQACYGGSRRILLTTKSRHLYTGFTFRPGDILILGRESQGVPAYVHEAVDIRLTVPMKQNMRSLNVGVSAAIVASEALRQLDAFPDLETAADA